MFAIIQNIINHAWQSNYGGDQQYIYYICGAVIVLSFVFVLDLLSQMVKSFRKSK